jgi:Icc-related predicted phosphoesterase
MKLIALPDLHGNISRLNSISRELSDVDLVLLVGDMTNGGGAADAARVIQAVRRHNRNVLAIPGNWDDAGVSAYLQREGINLDRLQIFLDQVVFVGVGGALPGPVSTPNEITETEFEQVLAEVAAELNAALPIVFVCHQPPAQTLNDQTSAHLHVGSRAVRAFIEAIQPMVCFTGHIHEAVGIDMIGATRIVNPGPLSGGGYAYAEITRWGVQVECWRV